MTNTETERKLTNKLKQQHRQLPKDQQDQVFSMFVLIFYSIIEEKPFDDIVEKNFDESERHDFNRLYNQLKEGMKNMTREEKIKLMNEKLNIMKNA